MLRQEEKENRVGDRNAKGGSLGCLHSFSCGEQKRKSSPSKHNWALLARAENRVLTGFQRSPCCLTHLIQTGGGKWTTCLAETHGDVR